MINKKWMEDELNPYLVDEKKYWVNIIEKNVDRYKEIPQDLLEDKNFIKELIMKNKAVYKLTSYSFKKDEKIAEKLLDKYPDLSVEMIVVDKLRSNKKVIDNALFYSIHSLSNLNLLDVWKDREIVNNILGRVLSNVYTVRKGFTKIIKENIGDLKNVDTIAETLVSIHSSLVTILDKKQRKRLEIQNILINDKDTPGLKYVLPSIKRNRDVIITAIQNNSENYDYINKRYKEDLEIIILTIKNDLKHEKAIDIPNSITCDTSKLLEVVKCIDTIGKNSHGIVLATTYLKYIKNISKNNDFCNMFKKISCPIDEEFIKKNGKYNIIEFLKNVRRNLPIVIEMVESKILENQLSEDLVLVEKRVKRIKF